MNILTQNVNSKRVSCVPGPIRLLHCLKQVSCVASTCKHGKRVSRVQNGVGPIRLLHYLCN